MATHASVRRLVVWISFYSLAVLVVDYYLSCPTCRSTWRCGRYRGVSLVHWQRENAYMSAMYSRFPSGERSALCEHYEGVNNTNGEERT